MYIPSSRTLSCLAEGWVDEEGREEGSRVPTDDGAAAERPRRGGGEGGHPSPMVAILFAEAPELGPSVNVPEMVPSLGLLYRLSSRS